MTIIPRWSTRQGRAFLPPCSLLMAVQLPAAEMKDVVAGGAVLPAMASPTHLKLGHEKQQAQLLRASLLCLEAIKKGRRRNVNSGGGHARAPAERPDPALLGLLSCLGHDPGGTHERQSSRLESLALTGVVKEQRQKQRKDTALHGKR